MERWNEAERCHSVIAGGATEPSQPTRVEPTHPRTWLVRRRLDIAPGDKRAAGGLLQGDEAGTPKDQLERKEKLLQRTCEGAAELRQQEMARADWS